ncbi:DUF1643 domain-containing protein [Actinobacillus delphinicola]|uniref:Uncharacterized protein conserved in bacteria n=1 Tax=Actinobacillus delphinicola TaxID=51161 RepID=A0A448TTD3_9PAST|nr:DUF1643 domain-containing protein [Actinobacillus delphinicola]VEJ09196.1 Uncharacterized protein conserved in bacteria [Actinobacillus delphinicola]
MISGAKFSDDRQYRYVLWRIWDNSEPYVTFVCLNPSTADEKENDPTIRKCISYARKWGYGGIYVINLFAFRATDPSLLLEQEDPVGKDNDYWITNITRNSAMVIGAWGNSGRKVEHFTMRTKMIKNLIPQLHYLILNKSGEPSHPLFLSTALKPIRFSE